MSEITDKQNEQLKGIFGTLVHGSAHMGSKELSLLFRTLGITCTDAEIHDILSEAGGKLDFEEFKHLMTKKMNDCDPVTEVESAFQFFDKDQDNFITIPDFQAAIKELGVNYTSEQAIEMLKEADLNDDGKVSKLEFSRVIL